jgi:hypothetical protein
MPYPYTEAELVQFVAAKIEEILPPGEGVENDSIIEAPIAFIQRELKESGYHILSQAPLIQVKQVLKKAEKHFPVNPPSPAINPNVRVIPSSTQTAYVIPCPTDFLRFLSIRLSTWKANVTELIPEESPEYLAQQNIKWTRGTELKPKAALISFSDYLETEKNEAFKNIGLAIECFSSRTAPTIAQFNYVPKVSPEQMPDDLVDAMVWECAGRTLLIMKQPERAAIAFAQVQKFFANKYGVIGG